MIQFAYTLTLIVLLPLIVPWYLYQILYHGKYKRGFFERIGLISKQIYSESELRIWIHAASVGEVLAAEPIIKEINRQIPSVRFYLTTNTDTGFKTAQKQFDCLDAVFQTPFDLPWIVNRFISAIDPSLLILMETEIWPNMITMCYKRDIPIVIANGRISDCSFPRYLKLKWFIKPVLSRINTFIMQSSRDADRIIALGAQETTVINAGNVKYDREKPELTQSMVLSCMKTLNWLNPSRVFVAGSTHLDEEKIICEAFKRISKQLPEYKMILAPRHVNRADEACDLVRKAGLKPLLSSACERTDQISTEEYQVLVLDVMGELFQAYSAGSISFVGGSLQPIGGHNVLEPAALGKPVLFGPYTANFADAVNQLLTHNAGRCVKSSQELAETIMELSLNPNLTTQIGEKALAVVEANRGAVKRHLMHILRLVHSLNLDRIEDQSENGEIIP